MTPHRHQDLMNEWVLWAFHVLMTRAEGEGGTGHFNEDELREWMLGWIESDDPMVSQFPCARILREIGLAEWTCAVRVNAMDGWWHNWDPEPKGPMVPHLHALTPKGRQRARQAFSTLRDWVDPREAFASKRTDSLASSLYGARSGGVS